MGTVRVIFEDDVKALRDVVQRESDDLDAAATSCPTLDAGTLGEWNSTLVIAREWIARVDAEVASIFPTNWATLYGQGRGIENVMRLSWWPRLTAAGCHVAFPQPPPPPEPALSTDNPASPFAMFGPIEGMAKALLLLMLWRELKG